MRALRVVGLGIDGRTVILETVPHRSGERRERFSLPADESLHAAVRGDLPRLGQIEIELESQMRPREIQTRIRSGASVDQVAAAAGVPAERIERFAYPVLLERSRTAELARQAHPVRSDGPDVRTLDEVVADTFTRRGHDYASVTWDSWRGESGKWVVQLRWCAGRSDNRAHWTFHPGADGGTVTVLDDHAVGLIDPESGKPLRTVPVVAALGGQPPSTTPPMPAPTAPAAPDDLIDNDLDDPMEEVPAAEETLEPERPLAVPDDGMIYPPAREGPVEPGPEDGPAQRPAPKRGRKNHPVVPSWEDVLLGVRSPRP
ncbi:MAG TPA: septation protein SepH [Pseudonocardiaceae bacterium]|jgi:hypothetical protein|nr:septation protein SepH [Pseudonocardiaceae bacterium]